MSQNVLGVTPLQDESMLNDKPAFSQPLFIKDRNNETWKISNPCNLRRSTVSGPLPQIPTQRQPSTTSLLSNRSKKASLPPLPSPHTGGEARNNSQYFNTVSTVSTLESYPMTPPTPTNPHTLPQAYSIPCHIQHQQMPLPTMQELYFPHSSVAPATPPPLTSMYLQQEYQPLSMNTMPEQSANAVINPGDKSKTTENRDEEDNMEPTDGTAPNEDVDMHPNKKIRQITVKSINNDYNVWINVEPKDTGESVAAKIFTIASFKTRKVLSIRTASGRRIPLDKTPVFADWEIMEKFKNGETWTVEWDNTKRSFVDKVLSKLI